MESSLTTAYVIEKIFAGVTAQQMAADILALADDWCPDVIISETYEFGGHIAAEVLNIPFVSAGICLSPPSESVITGLNRVRQTFGLPPDPGLACLYRNLHLHFVPPTLLPVNIVAPETVAIRPDPFDLSGTDTLPSWIEEMPDQPTIYMTLGTQFNGLRRVFGAVISAFRDQECNLIVTCGRNMDPRIFGVLPDHIHVERYIPQSQIFPYCDVVICHGGYNTMVGALVHGIPQVYIPISADQPFNAECCESAGTAVVLNKDTLTADLLRQAVHDVLRDPGYLEAARRIQLEISNMPGCDHAVSVIERAVRHNSD